MIRGALSRIAGPSINMDAIRTLRGFVCIAWMIIHVGFCCATLLVTDLRTGLTIGLNEIRVSLFI